MIYPSSGTESEAPLLASLGIRYGIPFPWEEWGVNPGLILLALLQDNTLFVQGMSAVSKLFTFTDLAFKSDAPAGTYDLEVGGSCSAGLLHFRFHKRVNYRYRSVFGAESEALLQAPGI